MTDERRTKINAVLDKRQNDLSVIMENVSDPHNISAVMRTCDAVGISEIYVLNTQIGKHKKFGRSSSSSAKKWMRTIQFTDLNECVSEVRKKYSTLLATHLGKEAKTIYETNFVRPTAIVFGNEKLGISEELLSKCDGNLVIPQVGMISSLNISVACAVTIYEAYRQKMLQGHYASKKLNPTQERELLDFWDISENL